MQEHLLKLLSIVSTSVETSGVMKNLITIELHKADDEILPSAINVYLSKRFAIKIYH